RVLRKLVLEQVLGETPQQNGFYIHGKAPAGSTTDGYRWHIKQIKDGEMSLIGGGEVVGAIPAGLPGFKLPDMRWDNVMLLLSSAFVISLIGFMEAISIAKAMATKTKQRLDPNQELIGQGLANIIGSFAQSYPASGSFSRSAVNINAGALTGMSSVFTGLVVSLTLLFLTPLLYHLPQAVLAAVIVMAVAGLVNVKAIKHAWQAHHHDGIAAVVTFIASLMFAPHLDTGILVGAGLAIILYLVRTMKPRVAVLGRYEDGTLRDASLYNLPTNELIATMRFDGDLYFANVPYFEDELLAVVAKYPKSKFILVVADGITEIDASGEEMINHLVQRLRGNGITMVFSGLKRQVLDVMRRTGLYQRIGAENVFATVDMALETIYERIDESSFDARYCPLNPKRTPDTRALDKETRALNPQGATAQRGGPATTPKSPPRTAQ
ncbi:MAG: SulP family inorganic anion transporter, partial [Burkholderiales bacterium]